ncbi:hypothetical protein BV20DRAFT_971841 [Pilatotrama ljubarskyi]|nr:hypothetical protein BV20DRAFT_971841 [Pilatotrama ljubarskyi]
MKVPGSALECRPRKMELPVRTARAWSFHAWCLRPGLYALLCWTPMHVLGLVLSQVGLFSSGQADRYDL